MKALIVDDLAECRWVTKAKVLKVFPDAQIRFAVDGLDGLEEFDSFKPDIVFSDLQMPNMDGDGFVEEVRKRGFVGPVILISGEPHLSKNVGKFTRSFAKYSYDLNKEFFAEIGFGG